MKQNLIRQIIPIFLLSILTVKAVVYFVPFAMASLEEATLTELMLEQKEGKAKEGIKEISVKEYLHSNFAFHFFAAPIVISDIVITMDASFNRSFFPSILTPPPNA